MKTELHGKFGRLMNKKFWKGKNVLITGHTGFKGAWLSLWLQQMGAQVVGYSNEIPTEPSLFKLANVANGMWSEIGADIRDLDSLKGIINEHKPEIVIHMAAQALVRPSYANPVETYQTNVMGTVNLLEAIRLSDSVKVCVNVTTDKCYENKEWAWGYRENEPMGGYDPYSSSKACSEIVSAAFRRSYFSGENKIGLATARAGNVIGGGDWATDRLIPDIFKAWLADEKVIIRSPSSIRPWQMVLEPLSGYLTLAEKLWEDPQKYSQAWNFGPYDNDAQPVGWIVEQISQELKDFKVEIKPDNSLHEATYLKLDCSKSRTYLGWKPRTNLPTTLKGIIEWYEVFRNQGNIREVTIQQIARFQKMGEK